jgi:hypothetical protein
LVPIPSLATKSGSLRTEPVLAESYNPPQAFYVIGLTEWVSSRFIQIDDFCPVLPTALRKSLTQIAGQSHSGP